MIVYTGQIKPDLPGIEIGFEINRLKKKKNSLNQNCIGFYSTKIKKGIKPVLFAT